MDAVFTFLFGGISLLLAAWAYFLKRKADKYDRYVEQSEGLVDMSENRLHKLKSHIKERHFWSEQMMNRHIYVYGITHGSFWI